MSLKKPLVGTTRACGVHVKPGSPVVPSVVSASVVPAPVVGAVVAALGSAPVEAPVLAAPVVLAVVVGSPSPPPLHAASARVMRP